MNVTGEKMTDGLKPCPFCGKPAHIILEKRQDDGMEIRAWEVECTCCCASTGGFYEDENQTSESAWDDIVKTVLRAVNAWNRRANE